MVAQLTVVGTGYLVAGQVTAEALAAIRQADVLFHLVSDRPTRDWLATLNPRAESLYDAYRVGRRRDASYGEMVSRILAPLGRGANVCAAFYGHPGVFAWPGHEAIRRARAAGLAARMQPAISAEDCLYADLEIDPGLTGSQSYEASHFLYHRRVIDPASALVLWQIGGIGVSDFRRRALWSRRGLVALRERLSQDFPADHQVVVYQASGLPVTPPRIERVPLGRLERAEVSIASTLFVPPLRAAAVAVRPGSLPANRADSAANAPGSLTAVGLGLCVAGQVTHQAERLIAAAERLFYLVTDPVSGHWLRSLNATATSLHTGYVAGASSAAAVDTMIETVAAAVERGQDTVLATSGHPAVYMHLTHAALARIRRSGHAGRILPGVSFEDCLIADLGLDPAIHGRSLLEATHFVHGSRIVDTSTTLVLLQPGAVGADVYRPEREAYAPGLALLADALARHYPPDHPLRIYESAQLPIMPPVVHSVPLGRLTAAPVSVRSTLIVPPLAPAPRDHAMVARLRAHARPARSAKVAV